ncbi:MAG: EAL domain-containing protein [Gammaproteobacteria bacterium]|nr:EAL domain-containing protein [Gammaproteobacteria bacterium]
MTVDMFQGVDVEKYRTLLDERFATTMALAIVDRYGRILDLDGELSSQCEAVISKVVSELDGGLQEEVGQYIPNENALLLLISIDVCSSESYLVMHCRFPPGESFTEHDSASKAAEIVYEAISDGMRLNCELNDMADDLSARYEELNLFYGLDDIVEIKDVNKGQIALKKLADNCNRYLNTDVVSIFVTSANIDVEAHGPCPREFRDKWEAAVELLREKVVACLVSHENSLVINDTAEIASLTGGLISAKIAATTIHSNTGIILGYLMLGRKSGEKDFSNSDRRLLRVIAEQASTIVSASYDVLTGLLNRQGILSPLNRAIVEVIQNDTRKSLLILDIDQFRMINDSCGREAGDELLRSVANQLKSTVHSGKAFARLENDKYAILVEETESKDASGIASDIIRTIIGTGFRWDGKSFDISAGVGIVELQDTIEDANEVLALGTISCDVAKQQGAGGIFLYDPASAAIESVRSAIDWVPHIRQALENDLFELYAQQIVPLDQAPGNAVHYEILLRLRAEDGTISSPFQMIKAAEAYNMVTRIDQWVIKNTLEALKKSREQFPDIKVSCSINMSGQSVTDEFFSFVRRLLLASPELIPNINLEITETAVVSNLSSATRLIESLRKIGVKFSLDDFGTGMSSFGYLRDLPIDYLKIDGSFVKHIADDPVSHAMVESIHRVGHIMGLQTVAEFVENDFICEKLRKMGVDFGQGYALNKPAPLFEQLERFSREAIQVESDSELKKTGYGA